MAFDAVIFFLHSLSLVYRNILPFTIDCMCKFIRFTYQFQQFLNRLYRFLGVQSCHLQMQLYSSLSYLFAFFPPCLIEQCETSNKMFNRCCQNRRHCLVPDLREKMFHVPPVSMMLALRVLKIDILPEAEEVPFCFYFADNLYHGWTLNFVIPFSCIY